MNSDENTPEASAAFAAVGHMKSQVEQAALFEGALESGFLRRFREPAGLADVSTATGLDREVVEAACAALEAVGVLSGRPDGRFVISDAYAPLVINSGLAERSLDALKAPTVRGPILRQLFSGHAPSYWTLDAEARVVLARNAGMDVRTPWAREMVASTVRNVPDWERALTRGARTLDMGCGIGSRICGTLSTYPDVTAVGIDLADDVLAVARERAHELGLCDRATFIVADAATFRDEEGFDVIWWPQTFFPTSSRRDATASAYANLRPGGLLVTVDPPVPGSGVADTPAVGPAIETLLRAVWEIPSVAGDALRSELEAAGFVDVAGPWPSPPVQPYMTARRPRQ